MRPNYLDWMHRSRKEENEPGAVVTPLLGSGILGTGAYGSHKLDDFLHNAGIGRHLKLNPSAIKAINEFAYAVPGKMKNPADFIYHYSDLANRASSIRLFKNDPRQAWEFFTNENNLFRPISKAVHPVNVAIKKLEKWLKKNKNNRVASFILKKIKPAKAGISGLYSMTTPLIDKVDKTRRGAYKAVRTAIGAHEAELAQSPLRAIVRLFNEAGGNSSMTNRSFNTTWTKPERLARELTDAINAYRNELNPETNKPYKNLEEAFSYWSTTKPEGKSHSEFLDFFRKVKGKNRKEIGEQVRRILAPSAFEKLQPGEILKRLDKSVFNTEVKRTLGSTPRWVLNPTTGKLEPPALGEGATWFNPKNGIKSVEDVKRLVKKSPALTWLKSELSNVYRGPEFGKSLKALRLAQFLRNGKTGLALGAGSALLGGLGLYNIGKNKAVKAQS